MAKIPRARSIAEALPNVRLMSPCRGKAILASYASRLSSVSMRSVDLPRITRMHANFEQEYRISGSEEEISFGGRVVYLISVRVIRGQLTAQAVGEVVIHFVRPEILLELAQFGVGVDHDELDPSDRREVLEVFLGHGVTVA